MSSIFLFHTGFQEIRKPDISIGRKNADFGQGFYLTPDKDFSERWAKEREGFSTYINTYELQPEGLKIRRFDRDKDWFAYIYANRQGKADSLKDMDVIIGPIANDTIYDVMGITTSGLLDSDLSLKLLQAGPAYQQIAIKTEKAAAQLRWISSRIMSSTELSGFRDVVRREEEAYQVLFAETLNQLAE